VKDYSWEWYLDQYNMSKYLLELTNDEKYFHQMDYWLYLMNKKWGKEIGQKQKVYRDVPDVK